MSDKPTEKQYAFTVALTVYSALKQSSKSKSTVKKQEKSVKTKELLFPLNEDNYIEFLESILEKHGQTQYKVSNKHRFSFKFTMAKMKSQRATEAMDVDNEPDYKGMVQKICDAVSDSTATKIFVDMKHVEKLPSHQVNVQSGDEESSISDDIQPPQSTLNHLDARLARWRTMLAKKYKNDQNEGLTYITPSGDALPLTPAMVLDWARAMEEGQATLNMPPNIPSFDPENKAPFLHPARKAQALNAASQSSVPSQNPTMPDINSLTSVILLQTLANLSSQSIGPRSPNIVTPNPTTIPATVPVILGPPTTPVHRTSERSTSPPVPSPSQLMRFLKYAETELHVINATSYERRLAAQHIGPDILSEIDDKVLTAEIGIPTGDIIRLKKGSTVWWNGPDAKRKRSDTGQSSTSQPKSPTRQPRKKVAYEKKYHGGGGSRFTGPPMIAGDDDDTSASKDYDLWYQSTDHGGAWLPVPRGFIVCEDGDEDDSDSFFK